MDCEFIGWCALSAAEQAAWLQAIGSLGAIAAVVGVAAYQRSIETAEAKQRSALEAKGRYTRANRAMEKFQKVIERQLETAKIQRSGNVQNRFLAEDLPAPVKDLELECFLMPEEGGDCLTAIAFFDEAQGLITESYLRRENEDRFIELLEYALGRVEIALKSIRSHLWRPA